MNLFDAPWIKRITRLFAPESAVLNLEELSLDFGLGLAIGFVSRWLVPGRLEAPVLQNPRTGLLAGMAVTFLLTLFLGRMSGIYARADLPSWGSGIVKVVLFLAVNWAYLTPLYFTAVHPYLIGRHTSQGFEVVLLLTFASLSVAALILEGVPWEKANGLYATQNMLLVFCLPVGLVMVFFNAGLAFAILGAGAGPVVLAFTLRWASGKLAALRFSWLQNLLGLGRRVVLPLVLGVAFNLWQTMTVIFMARAYANWNKPLQAGGVLLSLLLGGIIPLRLLANLAPPWRAMNTLVGLAMFVWYLRVVLHWLHTL